MTLESRVNLADLGADALSEGLTESGYEGWVAYVDGAPIFEEVRRPVGAYALAPFARGVLFRGGGRNCMEWRDLPHERVHRVELYMETPGLGSRQVFRADRAEGNHTLRFLQLKVGGVAVQSGAGRDVLMGRPERLGTVAYRMGLWDPLVPEAVLYEFTRKGYREWGRCKDPWAPRPVGWGLSRAAFGL